MAVTALSRGQLLPHVLCFQLREDAVRVETQFLSPTATFSVLGVAELLFAAAWEMEIIEHFHPHQCSLQQLLWKVPFGSLSSEVASAPRYALLPRAHHHGGCLLSLLLIQEKPSLHI